jgi:unsaturated rhamnogalacturonyl hydrolase
MFFIKIPGLALSTALLCAAGCASVSSKASKEFSDWPAGSAPAEVGRRVAENLLARKLSYETNPDREVHYAEACTWYGALTLAQLTADANLQAALIGKFEPLLTDLTNAIPSRAHVDDRVFGIVPLQIYLLNKDARCLELGLRLADQQWDKTTPDGISTEARYWIDDMYMITAVQVQAYRATRNPKYIERAALTMAAYLDRLQKPNGLFHHAPDSPFFWSRGNGWVAAGMTELLRSLPADNPHRARILDGYRRMMAALLTFQGEDGVWRQLIDNPESWPETSSTGMFAFAMITGVKHGWLDEKTYGPAARKAWLGVQTYLDKDANVRNVCEGTGKGRTVQYYLDRRRNTGDFHGQAPILWTASALLR